jgi:protein-tyrosine phosphatase
MINRLTVVCSGNICRSPYAQVLLNDLLLDIEVDSAGVLVATHNLNDHPAVEHSQTLANELGLSLSEHKAKQLTPELVERSDLILVMTHEHIEQVAAIASGARAKTLLLGQWIGVGEIKDPIGKDLEVFKQCFATVEKAANSWASRLKR